MTYSPTIDDLDMYLQVTVVYVDRAGADPRTVQEVSDYPVREDIVTSNQPPKFPDQSTLTGITSPGRTTTDRFIHETAGAGTDVGARVTAFDDKSDIEVLTYSLRDARAQVAADNDDNPDTPSHNDGHAASFDIDEESGQITVSAKAKLDADRVTNGTSSNPPYSVVVRAVDGDGDIEDIAVTIHVLPDNEPPRIDRVYRDAVTHTDPTYDGYEEGERAPTEMTHYEADRTARSATLIDTDLESSVLYTTDGVFDSTEANLANIQPATYTAIDPDDGDSIAWTLAGPDGSKFAFGFEPDGDPITKRTAETRATLYFASGPDFEKPGDANKNNVYEVTIVVTDSEDNTDELDVTVKVINSADDNEPGTVTLSNRQPEVAIELKATFKDPNVPTREVKWQWYRSTSDIGVTVENRTRCPAYDPHAVTDPPTVPADNVRYFLDAARIDETSPHWVAIPGATGTGAKATYTPHYNEQAGGVHDVTQEGDATTARVEQWTGGDIQLIRTTPADGTPATNAWSVPRCLRAVFTYRDDVDRTHTDADPDATDDVDQTLEGTFMGSEYPVKPIDEANDEPVFLDADGNPTSVYRAEEIAENSSANTVISIGRTPDNLAATDEATTEDDPNEEDDILTYSLSGQDADAFTITGTVGTGGTGAYVATDEGVLTLNPSPDYEVQRLYRVRITATDPGDDSNYVDVIVNITNVNEFPGWDAGDVRKPYAENGTADVSTYKAVDPERSGVTYSLVATFADIVVDEVALSEADIFDRALFKIGSISGNLEFKSSPNYEDPKDGLAANAPCPAEAATGICDNMYQVTVQADSCG